MSAIILPARCDRAAAETLLPEFLEAAGAGRIEIDASQVAQAGQAMLQMLAAARRSSEGATIAPSPALLTQRSLLACRPYFSIRNGHDQ